MLISSSGPQPLWFGGPAVEGEWNWVVRAHGHACIELSLRKWAGAHAYTIQLAQDTYVFSMQLNVYYDKRAGCILQLGRNWNFNFLHLY